VAVAFAVGALLLSLTLSLMIYVVANEFDRTLHVLSITLVSAAIVTTVASALVGRWASRRLLQPVSEVAQAAAEIAGGHLDIRLDVGHDPDLVPLAESFNAMVDALRRRIERDARFASDVSHELRSPLTTLSTSLGVLESRRAELPDRAGQALDLLSADLHRFQRLVEDLLEISRFDAGAVELALEDVSVGELVRHAVADHAVDPVVVDVDPAAETAVVRADKRRLERVLANLVDNAEHYGKGVVGVHVGSGIASVRIAVDDAGPGVAPGDRDRVFERFSRGPSAGRRSMGKSQGVGLGLALVAEHVRVHGGSVWVEDRPGGGARFVVELPSSPGSIDS
jgi:signal transduction histidine kinase